MNEFSAMGAWSKGVRFFAGRLGQHVTLLIGLGLIVPVGIQLAARFVLLGSAFGTPAVMAEPSPIYSFIPIVALASQAGALFASWRLGVGEGETLGGALRYGLIAGFVTALAALLLIALAGLAASQAGSPALTLFVFLFTVLPVILLLSLLSTVASALIGAAVTVLMTIGMVAGAATGNLGMAATMVGGSGFLVVLLLILGVLLLWLAARFSCATAIMADSKSYNLIAAARGSWELTWDEQWRIMRYLAVLGIILLVLLVGGLAALGGGAAMLQLSSLGIAQGIGIVFMLAFGLLMLFLAVMVPAGIYRQMIGERVAADIFA